MKRFWQGVVLLTALGGLAGLAGCSHSCVPDGWYGAHSVAAPKQPPGAPAIQHDKTFDIPGGPPQGKPNRAQACLVYPPASPAPSASSVAGRGVKKR
ncbi:MAG: hypothetical protein ACRES9_05900 [Gammaproteobacteria bacterium]